MTRRRRPPSSRPRREGTIAATATALVLAASFGARAGEETWVRDALETMGLVPDDTDVSVTENRADAFRMPIVDDLLAAPLETPERVEELADVPGDAADAILSLLQRADGLVGGPRDGPPGGRPNASAVVATREALEAAGAPADETELTVALVEAAVLAAVASVPLPPGVVEGALASFDETDESGSDPFELRAAERASIASADSFYAAVEPVSVQALSTIARTFTEACLRAARSLSSADVSAWVPVGVETGFGHVIVGTTGSDTYPDDLFVSVDPGGDDLYGHGAGGTGRHARTAACALDLSGDDTYRGVEPGAIASGVGGVGVLFDLGGDDVYVAGPVGLGAGVVGVGVLWDAAGRDTYMGTELGQGAATFGVGLLLDDAGDDVYRLGTYGQGFGGVRGVGVLCDRDGGDRYLATPLVTDVIRYDTHYVSFLQGAAFGARPDRSGGVGLLIDERGNDLYQCDIFGQGVAYWFGLGALVDADGHDVYAGYQYTQGSGVHYGVGMLSDTGGDDMYVTKSVSQGCGHDRAAGILYDARGNDTYDAIELSQGAGNANGFGLVLDASGDDAYTVRRSSSTLGYGNRRRGSGSIGLVVDAVGLDTYPGTPRDGSVRVRSDVGALVDRPGELSAEEVWPPDPKVPFVDRDYTLDELFVLASTGPPKFSEWRDAARSRFEELGIAGLEALVPYMDTRIPREYWGIKDVFESLGGVGVPLLAAVVDSARSERVRRQVTWTLGYLADRSAVAPLVPILEDDDAGLRARAAMSLGRLARADSSAAAAITPAMLDGVLRDPDADVRSAAVFALGALGTAGDVERLTDTLGDRSHRVRQAAYQALVRAGPEVAPSLVDRVRRDDHAMRRTWTLGVLASCRTEVTTDALIELAASAAGWEAMPRIALARALHAHGVPPETAAVSVLADDPDWRVRSSLTGEPVPSRP